MIIMATKQIGLSRDLLIHPGETLREAIEDRGISRKELALRTAFTEKHISKVLNGKSPISSKFALALETALAIDAVFWLNLQANYDIELASLEQPETVRDEEIDVLQDLNPIIIFWQNKEVLNKSNDKRHKVLQLRSILGVKNLTVIPNLQIAAAFRASNSKPMNPYVMFAWVKLCEMTVAKLRVMKTLDIELLKSSITKMKQLMFAEACVMQKQLTSILMDCGIKFSIVPNFPGAPVQGFIEKNASNEMVLCMTIRQKFADVFWFSFFHEIGHIMRGDVSTCFIDYSNVSDEKEKLADEFAKNVLIPQDSYNDFLLEKKITLQSIKNFAQTIGVPPYIVIGRLQKEKLVPYNKYSEEKLRFEWA